MKVLGCCTVLLLLLLTKSTLSSNVTNEQLPNKLQGDETWKSVENLARENIDKLLKQALPKVMRLRSEVNISGECSAGLMQFVFALKQMKLWAIQMIDAAGKPTPGILKGSLAITGSHKQCLDIEVNARKKFRGQYCTIDISPLLPPKPHYLPIWNSDLLDNEDPAEKIPLSTRLASLNSFFYMLKLKFGICIPSTCNENELEQIIRAALNGSKLQTSVSKCEIKKAFQFTKQQIIVICIIVFILSLVILGTLIDLRQDNIKKNRDRLKTILSTFSINKSFNKLFRDVSNRKMSSLHGIQFLTIVWIMIGLTYKTYNPQFMQNMLDLEKINNRLSFQTVSSARTSFNTLYFLVGLWTAYMALKQNEDKNFSYILFILQRYSKLTLLIFISLGFVVMIPVLESGPFWDDIVGKSTELCENSWWTYVLYISNWRGFNNMCTHAFQYASSIFQLHLLSLFLFIILFRHVKIGLLIIFTLIVSSVVSIAVFTYTYELFPTLTKFYEKEFQKLMFEKISLQPYTHVGPYCIGILTGYFIVKHSDIKIKKVFETTAWALSTFGFLMVIYFPYYGHYRNQPAKIESTFTSSVHRVVWCTSLSWIVFACVTNRAGPVNKFLSCELFIPLSRISHLAFFMLEFIIRLRYGLMEQTFVFNHYNMAYEIFGHFLTVFITAFLGYLLLEGPLTNVQNQLFSTFSKKKAEFPKDINIIPPKIQLNSILMLNGD